MTGAELERCDLYGQIPRSDLEIPAYRTWPKHLAESLCYGTEAGRARTSDTDRQQKPPLPEEGAGEEG